MYELLGLLTKATHMCIFKRIPYVDYFTSSADKDQGHIINKRKNMSREPRRYRITGELLKITNDLVKEREVFRSEGKRLANKYGFKNAVMSRIFKGGFYFVGFSEPLCNAKLENFKKPDTQKHYYPNCRKKAGKEIEKQINNLPKYTLTKIWDYIGYSSNPIVGVTGIYCDKKLNGEILFFTYDDRFNGHKDLIEIKKSEYYALIGE